MTYVVCRLWGGLLWLAMSLPVLQVSDTWPRHGQMSINLPRRPMGRRVYAQLVVCLPITLPIQLVCRGVQRRVLVDMHIAFVRMYSLITCYDKLVIMFYSSKGNFVLRWPVGFLGLSENNRNQHCEPRFFLLYWQLISYWLSIRRYHFIEYMW